MKAVTLDSKRMLIGSFHESLKGGLAVDPGVAAAACRHS